MSDQDPNLYNRLAGRSLERIAALSDGLFAIAMTLLVIELHAPAAEAIHSEGDLCRALMALGPRILMYLMSFLTLGIFWTGQQAQLHHFKAADRNLGWIHFAFLALVAIMPVTTNILAEFPAYHTAFTVYWANILLLGAALYWSWAYATRSGLVRDDAPAGLSKAVKRRIVAAQAFYALAFALSFIDTRIGIGLTILVQLYYAIAPRIPGLSKVMS